MKKLTVLLLCCLLIWPMGAWAQEKQDTITLTYNGQTYEYTYRFLPKCCGEIDTRHDINFNPLDADNPVGAVALSFPTATRSGDRYLVRRGEAIKWITFYTSGANGIRNYVSEPGSLMGSRLESEEDYFELMVNEMTVENGVVYVDAVFRGSFMSGTENFELPFKLTLLLS